MTAWQFLKRPSPWPKKEPDYLLDDQTVILVQNDKINLQPFAKPPNILTGLLCFPIFASVSVTICSKLPAC